MSDDRQRSGDSASSRERRESTPTEVVSVFDELKRSRPQEQVPWWTGAAEFVARHAATFVSTAIALLCVLAIGWLLLRTMNDGPAGDVAPPEPPAAEQVEAPSSESPQRASDRPLAEPTTQGVSSAAPEARGGPPAAARSGATADSTTTAPLPTPEQIEKRQRRDASVAAAVAALAALIGVLLLTRSVIAWLLQRGVGRNLLVIGQITGAVLCLTGVVVLALPMLRSSPQRAPPPAEGVGAGQPDSTSGEDANEDAPPSDHNGMDDGSLQASAQTDDADGPEPAPRPAIAPPAPRPGRIDHTPFRDMVARLQAQRQASEAPAATIASAGTAPHDTPAAPGTNPSSAAARIQLPTRPQTPFRDMVEGMRTAERAAESTASASAAASRAPSASEGVPSDDAPANASDCSTPYSRPAGAEPRPEASVAGRDAAPARDELAPARLMAVALLIGAALALLASAVPLVLSREPES